MCIFGVGLILAIERAGLEYLHLCSICIRCVQGKDLCEAELRSIIVAHDLNHDGVFDEVPKSIALLMCSCAVY